MRHRYQSTGVGKKTVRIILELKDKLKGLYAAEGDAVKQIAVSDKYSKRLMHCLYWGIIQSMQEALNKVYDESDSLQDIIKKALAEQI